MSTEFFLKGLNGRERAFAAGEPVFHLGDAVQFVHAVRRGVVHLVRVHEDGTSLILQRAGPGSILAEASVYSAVYYCDARAETSAVTLAVARNVLRRRLVQNPDYAEAWGRRLAHEVQRARLQAEILSLKTVAARLSSWVAWNGSLPCKGQWSNLAQEIGVSPEALYREIARRRKLAAGGVPDTHKSLC
jgi:CRP-like cAMP-binding protein